MVEGATGKKDWVCPLGRNDQNLLEHRKSMPTEFSQRLRGVNEVNMWKAAEFRCFLLYTGIIVLNNLIPEPMYHKFMLLCVAILLLQNF